MLQVHGEMNYNGAEAVGNFRIVGKPYVIALRQSWPQLGGKKALMAHRTTDGRLLYLTLIQNCGFRLILAYPT